MKTIEFNTDSKQKYENSVKSFLDRVDAQIEFLHKKVQHAEASEEQKFKAKIEALKIKRDEFVNKLDYVKKTEENKWEETLREIDVKFKDLSGEIDSAFQDIKDKFEHVIDNVKS